MAYFHSGYAGKKIHNVLFSKYKAFFSLVKQLFLKGRGGVHPDLFVKLVFEIAVGE